MSASVSYSVPVRNKSMSDGSDVLGTSFCKGKATRRSQCIATVTCSGGFSVSVAVSKKCKGVLCICLCLSLGTTTETDFILGILACMDVSQNCGKSDRISSLSTIMVSASSSVSILVDSSPATSFTVRTLE